MRRLSYMGIAMAAAFPSVGCTMVAKQAYYTVAGASGKFYELSSVDPDVRATYEHVEVKPFTNTHGDHVREEVMAEINDHTPERIQNEALFYPEGKTLEINGQVVHYTGKSGLSGSIQSALGGEVCVCRVQLTDAESGDLIGEANCMSTVKSAIRRGSSEIADGIARSVSKWLEKRLPEEIAEQRREELKRDE